MPTILDFFRPAVNPAKPSQDGKAEDVVQEDIPSLAPRRPLALQGPKSKPSTKRKLLKTTTSSLQPSRKRQTAAVDPAKRPPASETDHSRKQSSPGTNDAKLVADTKPQSPTAEGSAGPNELSEYERKRHAKMAANAQFLQGLGIGHTQLELTRKLQIKELNGTKRTVKKSKTRKEILEPVRRSRRMRGEGVPVTAVQIPPGNDGGESDEEDGGVLFGDSSVFHYTSCASSMRPKLNPPSTFVLDGTSKTLTGFTLDERAFATDPAMRSIYSVSFSPFEEQGIIATGGHGGRIAIYPMSLAIPPFQANKPDGNDASAHEPLISFKAHTGWVSSVSLARSICGKQNLLLTAANDGVLKLWDLNRTSSALQMPEELFASSAQHTKGIFGMDVCGEATVTCSKDGSITLSRFRDTNLLEVVSRFNDHKGVVKSVRFASGDPQRFASGGNDRVLRVFDLRLPSARASALEVVDAHTRAINSVQFHPTDDHLLLSAGFDPQFYLFDLRKPRTPVCTFSLAGGSSNAIFHPIFVHQGQEIAAANGDRISLYNTSDGSTVSCGDFGGKINYIAAVPFQDRVVMAKGGTLHFAEYHWDCFK